MMSRSAMRFTMGIHPHRMPITRIFSPRCTDVRYTVTMPIQKTADSIRATTPNATSHAFHPTVHATGHGTVSIVASDAANAMPATNAVHQNARSMATPNAQAVMRPLFAGATGIFAEPFTPPL